MKFYNKKFMKYVKYTMQDVRLHGRTKFANELKNIIETKELTLMNISTIYPFLQHRVDNPSHYDLEYETAIHQGEDIKQAFASVAQLKKEHRYMIKIISKYFTYEKQGNGLIAITKKFEEVA